MPITKSNQSIGWIALAAVAVVLVIVLVLSLRTPPQMGPDEEVFNTVDALYTAVRNQDDGQLTACEAKLNGYRDAGKLPTSAAESLAGLDVGALVNLEKSLTLADKLGGHLVTGHIDATGLVKQWKNLAESWLLEVEVPSHLGKFIAQKGSITVNGVSLTVNAVEDTATGTRFQINVIPHTYQVTNFFELAHGHRVNVEIDTIARYVERMTQRA